MRKTKKLPILTVAQLSNVLKDMPQTLPVYYHTTLYGWTGITREDIDPKAYLYEPTNTSSSNKSVTKFLGIW